MQHMEIKAQKQVKKQLKTEMFQKGLLLQLAGYQAGLVNHLALILKNMENHLKVSFMENQDYLLILEEYLSQFHI